MAKRSTPVSKIVIDELFNIPEGAEDQFVYPDEEVETFAVEDSAQDVLESDYDVYYEDYEYDDGSGDDNGEELVSPEDFTIVSQTIRRGPGGQQVVDIVVEVEEVFGATNYEIQVVKI